MGRWAAMQSRATDLNGDSGGAGSSAPPAGRFTATPDRRDAVRLPSANFALHWGGRTSGWLSPPERGVLSGGDDRTGQQGGRSGTAAAESSLCFLLLDLSLVVHVAAKRRSQVGTGQEVSRRVLDH